MVKVHQYSWVVLAAASVREDGEAMLQVSKFDVTGPALAQTAATTALASRYEQALQMEAQFEKLTAEAVRTGETPSMGPKIREGVDTALTTLEQELKAEKISNDDTFKAANDAVAQCNRNLDKAFSRTGGVNDFMNLVSTAKGSHYTCRGKEDEERSDEKTQCDSRDTYAQSSHDAGPKCPCGELTTAASEKQCLQETLNWGERYNTELGNRITKCTASAQKAAVTAQKCDVDQSSFETAFCEYDIVLTGACSAKTDCYKLAMIERGKVQKDLQVKETSEKIMWKSVKKVSCYLDMLDATKVTPDGFEKCKSLDSSTTHLDLVFLPAVDEAMCELVPAKPGQEVWATGELSGYASLPTTQKWIEGFEGLKSVTPCTPDTPQAIVELPQGGEMTSCKDMASCKDWDVKFKTIIGGNPNQPKGEPWIWLNKGWRLLCGHYSWDDKTDQAEKFCKTLGFAKGLYHKTRHTLVADSIQVKKGEWGTDAAKTTGICRKGQNAGTEFECELK